VAGVGAQPEDVSVTATWAVPGSLEAASSPALLAHPDTSTRRTATTAAVVPTVRPSPSRRPMTKVGARAASKGWWAASERGLLH
jgi:hypothetical protein